MVKRPRKFSREFKREVVRLAEESEKSVAQVARDLGIHRNQLDRWRKQFIEDGEEAFPGPGRLRKSDEETRRLRHENAQLREENEILKKALVFFSRESK